MAKRPICDTPGCGRTIPKGGGGHPETCPTCLACLRFHAAPRRVVDMIRLECPACGELHIDVGAFRDASSPHPRVPGVRATCGARPSCPR